MLILPFYTPYPVIPRMMASLYPRIMVIYFRISNNVVLLLCMAPRSTYNTLQYCFERDGCICRDRRHNRSDLFEKLLVMHYECVARERVMV